MLALSEAIALAEPQATLLQLKTSAVSESLRATAKELCVSLHKKAGRLG
jgi:hypothetical protein